MIERNHIDGAQLQINVIELDQKTKQCCQAKLLQTASHSSAFSCAFQILIDILQICNETFRKFETQ